MAYRELEREEYNGYSFNNRTVLDLTTAVTLEDDCFIVIASPNSRESRISIFGTYGTIKVPANAIVSHFMPKGTVIDAVQTATAPDTVYAIHLNRL